MKFGRGKMSRRDKIILASLLLLLTNLLTFFATAVYAVAPSAAAFIINNGLSIQWKDSSGAAFNALWIDSSNNLNLQDKVITLATDANIGVPGWLIQANSGSSGSTALAVAPLGTNRIAEFVAWRVFHSANYERIQLGSDLVGTNEFAIVQGSGGTGTNRPLIFYQNAVETMRLTITPTLQMSMPMVFGAASTPAAAAAGLGADANAGNIVINVPTTKEVQYFVNGVKTSYIDTNGYYVSLINANPPNVAAAYGGDSTNAIIGSSGTVRFQIPAGTASYTFGAAAVTRLFNIATAGLGIPAIYASYSTTGNTDAVANAINYTPPATAGRYCITAYVNVRVWTTPASFTVAFSYTDALGNARTDTMAVANGAGTVPAAGAITAVNRWYGQTSCFQVDNSATAITLSTTGTFTGSPTYDMAAFLAQVA